MCRNNGCIIENMDKGLTALTVPKWVPKIPQMLQNLSAQFFCPRPKVLYFNEKRLRWASVVHDCVHQIGTHFGLKGEIMSLSHYRYPKTNNYGKIANFDYDTVNP